MMLRNSIREASSPLRNTGSFLGIYLFDYEKFYFNRLYMIAIWTLYVFANIQIQIILLEEGLFTSFIGMSVLHANAIIASVTAIFNAIYKKTLEECFKDLCIVDDTLKSLGVSLKYRTTYRNSLIILILLFVVSVGVSAFALYGTAYFYSLKQAMCLGIMFFYPISLSNISDFNYWIILKSVEGRFARVNQYIEDLSADRENHGRIISKNTCLILKSRRNDDSKNNLCKVWIIMKLHRQLNKISREINQMFGVDFGLQMAVYFFTTIELISFMYLVYVQSNKVASKKALVIISQVTAHLLHYSKLVLINCTCENIQKKSNCMETVLTNFLNTVHDVESRQQISQFLMEVKQGPLQFTALGFISFGYKCLTSMFTSIAQTVIIMIQLGGMTHAEYVRPEHNTTTNDWE